METRAFGRTGKQVSVLGMGTLRFENPDDVEAMAEVVYHAFERGVNYFDTAPMYSKDRSETIVGRAVPEMRKTGRPFFVTSKSCASEAKYVRKDLERSLERLNVEAIDFYYVWSLIQPHQLGERRAGGALDEFRKAKEEGLVKHLCVSTHLGHEHVVAMLDESEGLFEGVLLGLNALNGRMRLSAIREAARRGMGIGTMNSLAGGLLTAYAEHFEFLKRPEDVSILDTALRFNLSVPEVCVALVGFRNKQDVDTAVDAVERIQLLNASELETFMDRVDASWEGFCTRCNYCAGCPVGVPVLHLMEAYNHHRLKGPDHPKGVLDRLRSHWAMPDFLEHMNACTACGRCERACTQHLPILDRFTEIRALAEAEAKRGVKPKVRH